MDPLPGPEDELAGYPFIFNLIGKYIQFLVWTGGPAFGGPDY